MLDSVVGAFLTQNVTDALSSKAFMTLSARFPVPQLPKQGAMLDPHFIALRSTLSKLLHSHRMKQTWQ